MWFYIIFGVGAAIAIGAAGFILARARAGTAGDVSAERIAALATVVATLAAGATLYYADRNERRLESERTHQYADKIYLGEAPTYYYDKYGKEDSSITRVVINASGVELSDVWIEAKDGGGVKIEGIQRCTLYSVPSVTEDGGELVPEAVHFKDPYERWRRTAEGELKPNGEDIPEGMGFGGSISMDVKDCSG